MSNLALFYSSLGMGALNPFGIPLGTPMHLPGMNGIQQMFDEKPKDLKRKSSKTTPKSTS